MNSVKAISFRTMPSRISRVKIFPQKSSNAPKLGVNVRTGKEIIFDNLWDKFVNSLLNKR